MNAQERKNRDQAIKQMRMEGMTLQAIADSLPYPFTRERVRQILARMLTDEERAIAKQKVNGRLKEQVIQRLRENNRVEEILNDYRSTRNVSYVAAKYGLSFHTVRHIIDEFYDSGGYVPPLTQFPQRYTDADIHSALRQAVEDVCPPLSVKKYERWAKSRENVPSVALIQFRIGWNKACDDAGVEHGTGRSSYTKRITEKQMLESLRRYIESLDASERPTVAGYEAWRKRMGKEGLASCSLIRHRIGWREAIRRVVEEGGTQ